MPFVLADFHSCGSILPPALQGSKPIPTTYPNTLKTLGDHLRKRRLELRLLQRQVAARLAVTESTIWNWESNTSTPALRLLPAIIQFLGHNPLPEAATVAGKLTRYRMTCGITQKITQKELAKHLGIDPCTLAQWERGDRIPTGLYRKLVADFLNGISGTQLFKSRT